MGCFPCGAGRAVVRALSGDADLLDRLAGEAFGGTVHSAFDRVVNVRRDADGRLCTLACRDVDNAPDTLVLDVPSFRTCPPRTGDRIVGGGGALTAVRLDVRIGGARAWSMAPPPLPMPAEATGWLREFLAGVAGSERGTADRITRPAVATRSRALIQALAAGSARAIREQVRRLIGLGGGLTPSGDDFLLGVALVCALPGGRLSPHRGCIQRAVDDHATRTNAIAHAGTAHAIRGRARESLLRLLWAMSDGAGPDILDERGRRVAAIGHTSGTDMLAGISAALDLDRRLRAHR